MKQNPLLSLGISAAVIRAAILSAVFGSMSWYLHQTCSIDIQHGGPHFLQHMSTNAGNSLLAWTKVREKKSSCSCSSSSSSSSSLHSRRSQHKWSWKDVEYRLRHNYSESELLQLKIHKRETHFSGQLLLKWVRCFYASRHFGKGAGFIWHLSRLVKARVQPV